jgi:glycerol-3-phosphate dehydrogenase
VAKTTDVLIIGGGITGLSVARELSKYDLSVTLVEKDADVGWGQTKATHAVRHPGARWAPGTIAQQMIAEGNQLMEQLIADLDIEFKKTGELVLAFSTEELESLKIMKKQAEFIKVEGLDIIGNSEIRRLEPNINPSVVAALYMPTAGVFNPFDLVSALYENARENGVDTLMDTRVIGIVPENNKFIVETHRGEILADCIVNAAGLFGERVARMTGAEDFHITHDTKATCLILDTILGGVVHHIVTALNDPKAFTRYKLVSPTFHEKLLIYTSFSEPAKGIEDRAVSKRVFDATLKSAKRLFPEIDFERHVVAAYAGLTARNDRGDFIVEASRKYPAFVHAVLPPPGITCSPAVGKRVVEILRKNGLGMTEKPDFNPYRQGIGSLLKSTPTQIKELVREDGSYGRVVCRCEKVSKGEIVEAIKRGATTLDGVKFRTRAGMGRCQTNYCGPEVTSILARELNQAISTITKKGRGSYYLH